MSVIRPTFSESWYRVSDLTPQLMGAVNVHRQHFRGVRWYVLQAPFDNQYFRISHAAYHFVAMLDGRRTVRAVWQICMERFGDEAPTQNEVIQLLCQLHAANLLQGNLAPDAESLFQRHQKRVWREVRSTVGNFFFLRIPLWDPDRFLNRWADTIGRMFSIYGGIFWAGILLVGLWAVSGHVGVLTETAAGVLDPENLPLLYAAIVIVKLFHELGHGFACKHFGRISGNGGEVHQMGISLIFFTPLPYVDATSAWSLKNKWHRIVISASGVLAELAIAALAAVFWVYTAEGETAHTIAFNVMLIASVSSLAFNGNPFLRYDAYYVLVDVLEIPNLESRARLYITYLVKKYIWGQNRAFNPRHTNGEKHWLIFYALASTLCRAVILSAIVLVLMNMFFSIGILLAGVLVARWLVFPMLRFIRYLATSPELVHHRERAIGTSLLAALFLLTTTGFIKVPDRCRVEGVVEPAEYAVVHMKTAGFVEHALESGTPTGPQGPLLMKAHSPALASKEAQLKAEYRRLCVSRQAAQIKETAAVQILDERIAALKEQIDRTREELAGLKLSAPIKGTWVSPDSDRLTATHQERGAHIGIVADLDHLRIRAVASQKVAARLIEETHCNVAIKVQGQPDIELSGRVEKIIPAGQDRLPSASLGFAAGGSTQIDLDDPSGRQTAQPFFEIIVVPQVSEAISLRCGQTMVLRFETTPRTLIAQSWRGLLQLFQERYHG